MNSGNLGVGELITRISLLATMSVGTAPHMLIVPRPSMRPQSRTAAEFVADTGGIAIMHLGRAGRWAEAERFGLGFLAKRRPPLAQSGESCAVLIGVTLAQTQLQKRREAAASMASFDANCSKAVYYDFFPAEAGRVRRVVNGEDASAVYTPHYSSIVTDTGGAMDVMVLNREGRHKKGERIGQSFLAKINSRRGNPEGCAVLIGVTYAQAQQRRTIDATRSLAQFDQDCKDVRYFGWFPGEAHRVRRLVNRDSETKHH